MQIASQTSATLFSKRYYCAQKRGFDVQISEAYGHPKLVSARFSRAGAGAGPGEAPAPGKRPMRRTGCVVSWKDLIVTGR